uniref:Uncharacterized protein n=1 Tax=Anguilla anguilla TaxID=7936 RepID=A0A0E9PUZ3_ANGAN
MISSLVESGVVMRNGPEQGPIRFRVLCQLLLLII